MLSLTTAFLAYFSSSKEAAPIFRYGRLTSNIALHQYCYCTSRLQEKLLSSKLVECTTPTHLPQQLLFPLEINCHAREETPQSNPTMPLPSTMRYISWDIVDLGPWYIYFFLLFSYILAHWISLFSSGAYKYTVHKMNTPFTYILLIQTRHVNNLCNRK